MTAESENAHYSYCGFCGLPQCDGALFRNGKNTRLAIFEDLQDAVRRPESYRTAAMFLLFNGIFNLRNAQSGKCQRCYGRWFTFDNVIDDETESMRHYLPLFSEVLIAMPILPYEHCARKMLSGLVLFRTEVLPIFHEKMGDEINLMPLIQRVLYWEGVIRNKLPVQLEENQCFINNHLSDDLKRRHTWWNEEFIDSEDLNATEEYSLTD